MIDPNNLPPGLQAWIDECHAREARWRRVLNWGPHDNEDDSLDGYCDNEQACQAELMEDAFLDAIRTLPRDEAKKLLRILANSRFDQGFAQGVESTKKTGKRGRPDEWSWREKINILCDVIEAPGKNLKEKHEAVAEARKAAGLEKGVTAGAVRKVEREARKIVGLE